MGERGLLWPLLALVGCQLALPSAAHAQETTVPEQSVEEKLEALAERLEKNEQETAAVKKENERLKQEVSELTQRVDEAEEADLIESLSGSEEGDQGLQIYGFVDMGIYYYQIDDHELTNGVFPDSVSFSVNRLVLYFLAQMTDTLSALSEVRFTFMPQGYEQSIKVGAFGSDYERVDTTIFDPVTTEEYVLGGLAIERLQFTYSPIDWFNITAGHFLTPFGIWNVDHSPTVLIPTQQPFFMTQQLIPLAQTGIQLYGRFFPTDNFYFDYALTVSNGRGPTESVYDLDQNKALGLSLRGTYERDDFFLSIGGYAYYGKTTDISKHIDVTEASIDRMYIAIQIEESYKEFIAEFDFLLKIKNFRLQSEYMRGIVHYEKRPPVIFPVIRIPVMNASLQPDYIKWSVYGLMAYDIVFESDDGGIIFTPYAMVEYCLFSDTTEEHAPMVYRGGINFRPSPFVSLKYELVRLVMPHSDYINPFWIHSAQVAISF